MTGATGQFDLFPHLIVLLSGGSSNLIYAWALAAVFPPKRVWAYWILQCALIMVFVIFKPYWSPECTIFLGTIILAIPLVCLSGSLVARIVAFASSQVLMFSAELPCGLYWVAATGAPVMSMEMTRIHLSDYLVTIIIHTTFIAVTFFLFVKVGRKCLRGSQSGKTSLQGGVVPDSLRGGAFICFPATQFVLLSGLLWVAFVVVSDDISYMIITLSVFLVCLAVDVFMFIQIQRYAETRLLTMQADGLKERAEDYLAAASSMQVELQGAARLRHDLRNHLQVVEGLCERGETAEARAYLNEAAKMLKDS